MVKPPEVETQVLRYFHAEKWRIGTIAKQLGIHHQTVERIIAQAGFKVPRRNPRPTAIEPFLPFIITTLERFPDLTASRLHAMVCERGYQGSGDHFRHLLARHRPRRHLEAYLRLKTLPGEQAQVDWGHFGHLTIGRARRPLMAFVMVLSASRHLFLRFFLDARMEAFLTGHVCAFQYFGGVPRVLLYDNLKSAVLERRGNAIRFQPTLLDFAGYYRFEPRPVAVARGNEKGRVERAIRYIRDNFFAARTVEDLETLNHEAEAWAQETAANRPCPEDKDQTVRQAFTQEAPKLLPLPDNPYPVFRTLAVRSGKTPYVRFDKNDYSIPHTHVQQNLVLEVTCKQVRITDGMDILADHPRSYDKGHVVEDKAHVATLVEEKRAARQHRATDRLAHAAPASRTLLERAAERGDNLGSVTAALGRLLDQYGAAELQHAVEEALSRDVPHPNAVRMVLQTRREKRHQPPPVAVPLPDHIKERDIAVTPHRLDSYNQLQNPPLPGDQGDD